MTNGEEKFYSPREDLENLKTSIDNLKTSIDVLILKMALPSESQSAEFTYTTDADDDFFTIDGQVLSATKNCYLRKLVIQLKHASQDPVLSRDSDLFISMTDEDGVMILQDNVVGLQNQFNNYQDFEWRLARHYHLGDQKVTANKELQFAGFSCNMETGLVLTLYVTYFEEYAI